jgi:hypothetical protein
VSGPLARVLTGLALAGAVVAAAGSLGPWVEFLGASVSGLEGDGLITLVLAFAAIGTVLRRLPAALPAACGLGIAVVGALDARDIGRLPVAEVGWGLPATVAGGIVLLAAAAGSAVAARRPAPAA